MMEVSGTKAYDQTIKDANRMPRIALRFVVVEDFRFTRYNSTCTQQRSLVLFS